MLYQEHRMYPELSGVNRDILLFFLIQMKTSEYFFFVLRIDSQPTIHLKEWWVV